MCMCVCVCVCVCACVRVCVCVCTSKLLHIFTKKHDYISLLTQEDSRQTLKELSTVYIMHNHNIWIHVHVHSRGAKLWMVARV